jgi:DNA-binding Lrp family transcriptional regulator
MALLPGAGTVAALSSPRQPEFFILQGNDRIAPAGCESNRFRRRGLAVTLVRKLRAAGILGGAHAEVAPAALGIQLQAMVAVRLTRHSRDAFDHFLEHAFRLEEVVAVYHVAGPNDFLVHVAVRDTQHLREMVLDNFTTWPEVDHIETALIFDHRRKPALPDLRTPDR